MGKKRPNPQAVAFDDLYITHPHAAGIDVGASELWVAVPESHATPPIGCFGTYTPDLHALAQWLLASGVDTVALESTGLYWLPLYEVLDAHGLEVYVVNGQHSKNVPGRKSDVADCQWLQKLHSYGLLRASFRPTETIAALRALVRQRQLLVEQSAMHIQHLQKALLQMNLRLTEVVSDISGLTGLRIIRAIVAGERDPQQLAALRDPKCARSATEIAAALSGHYRAEHLFALRQALEGYDFYQQQVAACDRELDAYYASLPDQPADPDARPPRARRSKRRKNQAHFDLARVLFAKIGVDLTAIEGIDALTVQTVIAEIGLDMTRWPTVKHFTSWLALSPHHRTSGGKRLSSRTKKTANRAATALRLAAQSLARSQSALGAFYRRIRAKHGPPKAVTATAHKLARIIYAMLQTRRPYHAQSALDYEQQHEQRLRRSLDRKAKRLGLQLVPLGATLSDATQQASSPLVS
jgi:transposase